MFSATKFAIAGAIVALFGSFVLTGVLTQPSHERLPAAGAPASATAQVEPTEATPSDFEPMVEAEPDAIMTPDLLPGVDLVVDEIEPGVYRVLSDGVRDLSARVQDVTMTPDGVVWVEIGVSKDWSLVRLGEAGVSRKLGRSRPWQLGLTAAGAPVVSAHVTRVFDGETWVTAELTAHDECVRDAGLAWGAAVAADGGCWTRRVDADEAVLAHFDAAGRRTQLTAADIGLGPDQDHVGNPVAGPDGTIWVPVHRATGRGGIFDGLLAYDGSAWSFFTYDADDAEDFDYYAAVDGDGVVWLSRLVSDAPPILSWDGESWTSHEVDASRDTFLLPVRPWPNGTVWFGSDARWDGASLDIVQPPVPWGEGVQALTRSPDARASDGSAWLVVGEQLYVITSEPVTVRE